MKSLSMILLCLTMLLAMAACQTAAGEEPGTDSIEFVGVEEHKGQGSNARNERFGLISPGGTQPYYGVINGHYLTNKEKKFTFSIYDLNNPNNGETRIHDEGYVPALFLQTAISKGDTIYVLGFKGSNDHQKLLEFAAEYIDENYDLGDE